MPKRTPWKKINRILDAGGVCLFICVNARRANRISYGDFSSIRLFRTYQVIDHGMCQEEPKHYYTMKLPDISDTYYTMKLPDISDTYVQRLHGIELEANFVYLGEEKVKEDRQQCQLRN